ncbi:MAG: hypothetical protein KDB71_15540 [Mycobacterium sp.]|nr:hypothetical protein [Mycobacterium sp.]
MSLDDQREAQFQEYLTLNEPYVAAIREAGDEPWHGGDIARRRDLYMRRYQKPPPPAGLFTSLADIRADETWQPASEAEHAAA